MLEFHVKMLSRKELQHQNAEFTSEASSISQEEAGVEEGVKENEEMQVTGGTQGKDRKDVANEGAGDDKEGAKLWVAEMGK
jgi:hypothetical protein